MSREDPRHSQVLRFSGYVLVAGHCPFSVSIAHIILRPSLFFVTLPFLCIIVNTNQKIQVDRSGSEADTL